MTTKEFTKKALKGGYNKNAPDGLYKFSEIILDPKAWIAVASVEGWRHASKEYNPKWVMFSMIDHLVSGGTIESYLETL